MKPELQKYFPKTKWWVIPALLALLSVPWVLILSATDLDGQFAAGIYLLVPCAIAAFFLTRAIPRDPVLKSLSPLSVVMRIVIMLQGFFGALLTMIPMCM